MPRLLPAISLIFCTLGSGAALASQRCEVPLADWQPRAAVEKMLEAKGWRVTRIRTKDGCYRVKATNDKRERYEGTLDPATLRVVKEEIERD